MIARGLWGYCAFAFRTVGALSGGWILPSSSLYRIALTSLFGDAIDGDTDTLVSDVDGTADHGKR